MSYRRKYPDDVRQEKLAYIKAGRRIKPTTDDQDEIRMLMGVLTKASSDIEYGCTIIYKAMETLKGKLARPALLTAVQQATVERSVLQEILQSYSHRLVALMKVENDKQRAKKEKRRAKK